MKRYLTILLFLAIVLLGYWQRELFLEWIRAGGMISIIVSVLFVAIIAFFPVVPFVVVTGVIGSVFGTWTGTAITLSGAVIGSMLMFWMARYGFRDWAQNYIRKYPKVQEFERYFEKNAFLSILFVRLIPVLPSQAVNILSGVSLVPATTFFLASVLGKLPSNLVFNLAGSNFAHNKLTSLLIYAVYFLAITVAAFLFLHKRQLR
ncbi:TVP38/TMEM64 family protein [Effusibacillus pohliae]|uniref:TVP38/TMEM64 family protein n=1 Tax=Effusibacillus pohliae TaxID=232270 RepID=UPI000378EFA2|nr:TVP38/TMEM64 family protein [Effusibacillus pohliae]